MRWLLPLLAAVTLSVGSIATQAQDNNQVNELTTTDYNVGTGPEATSGMDVLVHYTGWVYDKDAEEHHGKKFDSSYDAGHPFTFRLGAGQVIKGWDQGVVGMRVGGIRTLVIPAALGYGARGAGEDIPPNSALVFNVELLGVAAP
ncbi:MAG: FKBP-type peptidyl-prolyl cis-trans isomerase [Rhodanobacter sp.]